jgi:GT2 family glycosyltransferase
MARLASGSCRVTTTPRIDADLTLVIPTLGRPILRRMLEAVRAGDSWPARVIIVDQGRQAEIAALADEHRAGGLDVVYLPSSSTGRSAGLNLGLERVETRFVVITDDDCLVAPDWIARIGERLRRHPGAIITGRVEAGEGQAQLSVATSTTEQIQRRPALRFDRLSGGNMGLPLEVARRVGPFTESPAIRTAEDGEFAYRALRAGVPIVYAPEVVVTHLAWRDTAERDDQYYSYALSQGGFYGWYLRQGDAFIALRVIVHVLRASRRWLFGRLRGDADLARNGRAYVLGLLPGLRAGWRSRGAAR